MQDTKPNWPVVGKIYTWRHNNSLRTRVRSIEPDGNFERVTGLFVNADGTEDALPLTCYADSFRSLHFPEDKSPIPALVKALKWYAEQSRLARLIHSEGDAGRHALADDGGKMAREALALAGESEKESEDAPK